ncbi:MAG: methyltransferase domain-containing protein [Thermodesulfobacteriota bacterium]
MITHHEASEGKKLIEATAKVDLVLDVLRDMKSPVDKNQMLLDLGCGRGFMVYALRKLGYKAYGADIVPPAPEVNECLLREGLSRPGEVVFRVIDPTRYMIPFEEETFDLVFSFDVLEHVMDVSSVLREIWRVLKPGGKSLHSFPSRYRILECHTSVPFGGVYRGYPYVYFWAWIGLRNKNDKGRKAADVALDNYRFLTSDTNYLTSEDLGRLVSAHFGSMTHVDEYGWKLSKGIYGRFARFLSKSKLPGAVPLMTRLLSPFARRTVFFEKPFGASFKHARGVHRAS